MALGMEIGLGQVHTLLDGDTAPLPKRGKAPPPQFSSIFIVAKRLDESRCRLVCRPLPRRLCVRWGPSPLPQKASAYATLCSMWTQLPPEKGTLTPTQFLAYVFCGQMAGWMKKLLCTAVDLGPRPHCTRRGPSSHERGTAAPLFLAHVYCGNGRPSQLLLSSCLGYSVHVYNKLFTLH